VPDVGGNRQPDRLLIKALGSSRAAHPAAVLEAGMFSDGDFSSGRAPGEELTHTLGELLHILAIQLRPARRCPFPPSRSGLLVSQAFLFGLFQRLHFDQQPLPLVPF
jgi:hypothetical protein